MLTLYEFNRLPKPEQYQYVFSACTYLASYVEDEIFTASLYHADSFFIEVWYNMVENKLDCLRTFKNSKLLEPYLLRIDLGSLPY